MKKIVLLMTAILMIASLTACATSTDTASAAQPSSEKETAPVEDVQAETPESKTFEFMLGDEKREITVPYEPQKIVVIGYDLIDIIDALGHKDKIVGVPNPADPMFPEFLEGYETVASVGSLFGDDLEAVAGLKPDLILAGARTMAVYDDLSEIAPTAYFTIPGMNSSGFEDKLTSNIVDIAYLLNEEEKAHEIIKTLKGDIAGVKAQVESAGQPSALFLTSIGKAINVFTDNPESRFGFVYNELGFTAAAGVTEISEEDKRVNDGEASRHGNSVSFEFISAKNPEYIIVLDVGTATHRSDLPASDTLDNPLVGSTIAAQQNQIVYLNGTAWYLATGGVEATTLMMNDFKEAFGK